MSRSPAFKEEAQEGGIPDYTNATSLSESPNSYRRSTARRSEARPSTPPSSHRPSTTRSSTRRGLSPSDNELSFLSERARADSHIILSNENDDQVTFLSAQTKQPDKAAETQASPSKEITPALNTGLEGLGKKRSAASEQEEGTSEDLPTAATIQRSAPRKKKRVEARKAINTAVSDTKYSVASLPPGNLSGKPYINVKIAAVSRNPCYQCHCD